MGVSDAEEPESDEADGGCGIANDIDGYCPLYTSRMSRYVLNADVWKQRSRSSLAQQVLGGCGSAGWT